MQTFDEQMWLIIFYVFFSDLAGMRGTVIGGFIVLTEVDDLEPPPHRSLPKTTNTLRLDGRDTYVCTNLRTLYGDDLCVLVFCVIVYE